MTVQPQEAYEVYLDNLPGNTNHPQLQGLDVEAFDRVMADELTATTKLDHATTPQVVDIEHYEWLNHDFYARKFPGREVRQFVDYGENDLSHNVLAAVGDLAAHSGILAIDLPQTVERESRLGELRRMLGRAGIGTGEPELLGTQTYFAGRVDLTKEYAVDAKTNLYDTFQNLLGNPDFNKLLPYADKLNGVWLHSVVEVKEAERMLAFYEEAYEILNDHPCRQGLDPENFQKMLEDPDVLKVISRKNGKAESLFIATYKIQELSWVNFDYYKNHYNDDLAERKLLWFPGIATDPESDSMQNGQRIVSSLSRLAAIGGVGPTLVFDFCDRNTGSLDKALEYWMLRSGHTKVRFDAIADQKYYALPLSEV